MAREVKYKQVKLVRTAELEVGLESTVTHIPSSLAKKGKFVELKDGAVWLTWQVVKVSEKEMNAEQAKTISKKFHQSWGSLDMPRDPNRQKIAKNK